jgi:hypothetical protein
MPAIRRWIPRIQPAASSALGILLAAALVIPVFGAQDSANPPASASPSVQAASPTTDRVLPRGKKLMLADGSFQLVREYIIEGDRVRYYSLDSSQWEQMPASMVDWDATRKVETEEAQRDAAIVAKVHKQEAARVAVPLDIDASLEVAPGIFLPPGEHLFVFVGKAVLPLPQAETDSKLSKGHFIEQVMVPIPIIPTRHSISIAGTRAKFRIGERRPEFYIRVASAREPELVLIRAKPHGDSRHVENLDQIFGEEYQKQDSIPMQRWDIAQGVYRYTLGQPLAPGEYAIAEMIRDEGAGLYVWDFGVDPGAAPQDPKLK